MQVIPALLLSQQPGYFQKKPAVGCPWAGKEIENPTQTRVWRGLVVLYSVVWMFLTGISIFCAEDTGLFEALQLHMRRHGPIRYHGFFVSVL